MVALYGQGQACIFCVTVFATICNGSCGRSGAAFGAISANLQAAHDDVESAIALNLTFEAVEKITLEFHDLPATKACHVDVIALRTAFVKMLFPLHVHEVEFIDQPMTFEQAEGAVDGNAVNSGIQFAGMAQNLCGVEMLFSSFYHAQNSASLMRESNAARGERSLQSTRRFAFGKRHK